MRMPWPPRNNRFDVYCVSSRPLRAGAARTSAYASSKPTDRNQGADILEAVRDARLPADAARPEHWTLVERRQTKAAPDSTLVGFRVSLSSHKLNLPPTIGAARPAREQQQVAGSPLVSRRTEYQPQLIGNTRSYASSTREDRQAPTIIGELLVAIKDELLVVIKEQP